MQRRLKRWLAPFLPRWMVDLIKERLTARLNRGPVKTITVEPTETAIRCTIDQGGSFLAPLECGHDLSYHQSTREGRAEFSGIAEVAKQGGILFDIGAHAGIVSALFCAARPLNKVYSFEPSPISQKRLDAIRTLNHLEDRMFIQPTAIGQDRAKLEMLLDPAGGFVQIQHFEHSLGNSPIRIEVEVENISQASERLGIIPNVIKIDIEGYEYDAIQGGLLFLRAHRPLLLLELHHNYLEQRGLSPKQVMTMLTSCGYAFFTYTGQPLSANAIADSPLQSLRFLARPKSAA